MSLSFFGEKTTVKNLKFLSVNGGNSGSGFSFGESALEFGTSGSHFGGIHNDGRSSGENSGGSNWDVGSGHPEPVDGVSDVVNALEKSVGIDVAVRSAGDTVGGVGLLLGGVDVLVSVVEGSEFVLAVVLDGGRADDGESGDGGGKCQGSGNWESLNLRNEWTGDGADELGSGGLDKLGDWCWLGQEKLGGDSVCDNPEGGGCCQNCWAFWDGDGLKGGQWNSIPWINR
jgi:hypothetical protein